MKRSEKAKLFASLTTLTRSFTRFLSEPSGRSLKQLKGSIENLRGLLDPGDDGEFLDAIEILEGALSSTVNVGAGQESADHLVGSYATKLTYLVVQEMDRRKIPYRLKELDSYVSQLYAPLHHSKEAASILSEIKDDNKRIRV